MTKKRKVVIVGAGPAGLTCAYYLLKNSKNYEVIILEEEDMIGGISKTVTYDNNKMDLGGHRFFSKSQEVNDIWLEILKIQGSPSKDDKILGSSKKFMPDGPDPSVDDALLIRNRVSRIYYDKKFFDYPISLSLETIYKLGFLRTIICAFSYFKSSFIKLPEDNLENFYINRFGKKLYKMFFYNYTEKVWGKHPKNISADWGSQRAKGLSVFGVIKDSLRRLFHLKSYNIETSLIDSFYYPKYGPGQMWEKMSLIIENMGGTIIKKARVFKLEQKDGKINSVFYEKDNKTKKLDVDILVSSMPLKDLCEITNNIPKKILNIATSLPYRDFITLGLIVKKLNLKNETNIKTVSNIVPDNWIYVQDDNVKMGRIQIFNNWSPYLVDDLFNTVSLGLEYFCQEGDRLWNMKDSEFKNFVVEELEKMKIINREDVLNYNVERVKKAYPAYFGSYKDIDKLKTYLDSIENLYCIGRNGQHRYNNMDHSMLTGIEASKNIINDSKDKTNVWAVNTEKEYIESKN